MTIKAAAAASPAFLGKSSMNQSSTSIDEKLARGGPRPSLPFFLQKRIKFVEAKSTSDEKSRSSYRPSESTDASQSKKKDMQSKVTQHPRLCMEWQRIGPIGPGLANLGNSCFLNSVLQCLVYTAPLANTFLAETGEDTMHFRQCRQMSTQGSFCLLCELHRLVRKCLNCGGGASVLTPTQIVSRLKSIGKQFRVGRQEDAHEFLRLVVDSLQKACLGGREERDCSPEQRSATLVQRIFGGKLESRVTCLSCKHQSRTVEPFLDLSLEVRQAGSITAAIDQFTAVERLSVGNRYRCESCRQLVGATKQFRLMDLPNILTIHLKRFLMSPYGEVNKVGREVSFSPVLDLSRYCQSEGQQMMLYDLYAVLVHEGQTCHSGHYHCFVRASNGSWYSMNDESVHQVSLGTVLKQKAYMLFYQRRSDSSKTQAAADELVDVEEGLVTKEHVHGKRSSGGEKRKSTEPQDELTTPQTLKRCVPTPPPSESEPEPDGCVKAVPVKTPETPVRPQEEINLVSKSWWHLQNCKDAIGKLLTPKKAKGASNGNSSWSVTPLKR